MAIDYFEGDRFFIERKAFTVWDAGFHVYGEEGGKLMYVDVPSFRMSKSIVFYVDEKKDEKIMAIRQDKVVFAVSYRYTLFDGDAQVLAKLNAELVDNLLERTVEIANLDGDPICRLAAGSMTNTPRFTFECGDNVIGLFDMDFTQPQRGDMFCLDLRGELGGRLDKRVALAAAMLLQARMT
jgi:uncharacterized protein YxjI